MGVHAQQKGNEEMMGVPKCFEGLLPNFGMRRSVHEEHAKQHDVASDSTSLLIMDLERS